MEFFNPKHLNYDFTRWFKPAAYLSVALMILSIIGFFYPGLNYGIDFRGGIETTLTFQDSSVKTSDLRTLLDPKLKNFSIIDVEGRNEFIVTAQAADRDIVANTLRTELSQKYGQEGQAWNIAKLDVVGPKVGADLRKSALLALIYTCLLVTIYMYWRFDLRYSPGALACIFHDLVLTMGFMVLTRGEFDTTVLAAFLTLAGYSINDTVVVFDRIREMEHKNVGRDKKAVVNEAINSTLSRTIMTAGTTLMSCAVLYFLGGPTLRQFSSALFFGIVVGTYSSAMVAAPLYIWADRYFGEKEKEARTAIAKG